MGLPFENADYNEDEVGARKIPELTDVIITNLADKEILIYDLTSGVWENKPQPSTTINDINDITNVNITNIQDGQRLVYNSSTSKWINSTITDNNTDNLNDLTDTLLTTPFGNNEVLKYNTTSGKWENGNLNLNNINDVNITSLQNGEVLKYNSTSGKWENSNRIDTLNELTDVTLGLNQNNQVLKYNNSTGVYENQFVNLTELADTNITTLNNDNILIYKTATQKWEPGNISYTETDPVFTASPAGSITSIQVFNWDTAYLFGDHRLPGYLTSYTETDPVFTASPAGSITSTNVSNWNTAYSWGDHAIQGYLKTYTETDPVFTASPAGSITNIQVSNWDTAYLFGDHRLPGYLTSYTETDPVFTASPAGSITNIQVSNWDTAYLFGDHRLPGYLTSYTETDPVFIASPAGSITSTNVSNWNTAYSWGNHAIQGYLKTYIETDPVFTASPAGSITNTQVSNWNTAYGWGNHASAGYLTSYTETDPVFIASPAGSITSTNVSNWNTTYSWGNHAIQGYLKTYTETDPVFTASPAGSITSTNVSNWNTAYSWGNHVTAGYLTSYTETDPVFIASPAGSITSAFVSNWNTAYGWGNHASAGYLTSYTETDPVFIASPAGSITSTNVSNWNTAYSWGNHATAGYLTSYTETDPVFIASAAGSITNGTGFLKNNGSGTWSYDTNTYLTSFTETDPVFIASAAGSITNGTGFLKNNGSGTWTYDSNTYLTTANIYGLNGLTWNNLDNNELIRRVDATNAEGAGMKLVDAVGVAFPQNVYNKTISYFNRVSPLNIQFGAIDYQYTIAGYNQRIIPYNPLLTSGTDGLYLHHSPALNNTNVKVGVNEAFPTVDFQVGTTMYVNNTTGNKRVGINVASPSQDFQVGNTFYVDNTNRRVGIGIVNPTEDLEVDGSIQIDSANVGRLKFQQSGQNPHALCEIDGEQDGTNGGQMEFYTKEDGGSVTKKMYIKQDGKTVINRTLTIGTENTQGYALVINGTNFSQSGMALCRNGQEQIGAFYISGNADKDLVIDAQSTLTNMGIIFRTGTSAVDKLRINNNGAFGFGFPAVYGNSGQFLKSNGSGSAVSWDTALTGQTAPLYVDTTNLRVGINVASPSVNFEVLNTMYVNSDTRKVGIVNATPTTTFQVATTLNVNATTERVGIGIVAPAEKLDVDSIIQITAPNATTRASLYFRHISTGGHDLAQITSVTAGTNGSDLQFWTADGGARTRKITINDKGAIGIGATPNYGTAGQFLKSNDSGSAVSWVDAPTGSPSVAFKATTTTATPFTFSSGAPLFSIALNNTSGNKGSFNIGGGYNPSTGLFTAPSAGLYYFEAVVFWGTNLFNANYLRISITTPATSGAGQLADALLTSQFGANEAFNTHFSQNVSGIASLALGETIGLYVFANDVTNASIVPYFSYFTGYKLDTSPMGSYTAGTNMSLVGAEFNIPQSVATTASPTFTNVTATLDIYGGRDVYVDRYLEFPNSGSDNVRSDIYSRNLGSHNGGPQNHMALRARGTEVLTVYYDNQNTFYVWVPYSHYAAGYYPTSDDRIKSNEKPITEGVSVIEKLQPKIYDKHQNHRVPADKEDNDLTGIFHFKESGFIAQEVDKIPELKHLVKYNKTNDLYAMSYEGIIPYLVQSIKELNARIKVLESK